MSPPRPGKGQSCKGMMIRDRHPSQHKGQSSRTPRRPLTHEQLLTLARKVQAAAHDGELVRLEFSRLRLVEELAAHFEAEHEALYAFAGTAGRGAGARAASASGSARPPCTTGQRATTSPLVTRRR